MVVTTLVAAVVIIASVATSSMANKAEKQLATAEKLSEAAFQRIALRSDWQLFHNERTAFQWLEVHRQLGSLLLEARQEFKAKQQQSEIGLLLRDQPGVAENFKRLEQNWKAIQSGALDATAAKRVEDQLVGEMTARAHALVVFSSTLAGESRLKLNRALRFGVILPSILVIVLAVMAVAYGLIISISVLRGLAEVREGTEKVAAGDLDFRIDESGRSEVAEVAHAFNEMTGRVKDNAALREGINRVFRVTLTEETEDEIARACLAVAEEITGAGSGFIGLVNERGLLNTKSLSAPGWKECRMPESEATRLIQDMEITSFWGRVIREGKTQLVNDPASDPDATGTPEGHPPIDCFLGVPLKQRDETTGVIALANREGGFRSEDIKDLEALGVAFMEALSRKRAEDEVRLHRERLEELVGDRTAELQRALAEVERSNAELQQFAYVASHDLQEPLRMIASYVQLLQERYRDRLDDDADEFIRYAVDGADRMQTLINDLLALSRVATSKKKITPTDANSALGVARANLGLLIEENNAVVTSEELPTVSADEAQLVQLFQNLIANSIKFRREEPPRVHLWARQRGAEWVFSVQDNGIGFDPEHAERIFIIFQRLNPRSEYGGTGIGLAISKSIVERHGGRIWAESVPGEGSTFHFTVPLIQGGM
jgi:signal transduction histidine kinase